MAALPNYPHKKNRAAPIGLHDSYLVILVNYFTSSKTTLTDYQCVSTGCCTHVAKTEITIDNQHVTKSLQRYEFLPKQPKENTEKTQTCHIFLILVGHRMLKWKKHSRLTRYVSPTVYPQAFCLLAYILFLHFYQFVDVC